MGLSRKSIEELSGGELAIIGMPFDDNSSFLQGPAKAPRLIIDAIESDSANFFTESLTNINEHPQVIWCGNAEIKNYESLSEPISAILNKNAIPFSFGGDHSITFPILKAIHQKHGQVNILHFDAHGDLYNELDNNKYSHACPFARIMENELASSLTQVGIRTMNTHQKAQVERFDVNVIQMKDWQPNMSLNIEGPTYLSFDIDVLDPAFAPGVSHHEPGGFSTREVLNMLQNLKLDIVGMDLVEYNPNRDLNGVTAMTAAKIAKEMIDLVVRK